MGQGRIPGLLGVGQAVLPDFLQPRPRLSQRLPATPGFFRPPDGGFLGTPVHEFPGLAQLADQGAGMGQPLFGVLRQAPQQHVLQGNGNLLQVRRGYSRR